MRRFIFVELSFEYPKILHHLICFSQIFPDLCTDMHSCTRNIVLCISVKTFKYVKYLLKNILN